MGIDGVVGSKLQMPERRGGAEWRRQVEQETNESEGRRKKEKRA
jgi:hypothetical protein